MKITIEGSSIHEIVGALGISQLRVGPRLENEPDFVEMGTVPPLRELITTQTTENARLRGLLRRCVPFIYRAKHPSKNPHEQNAIDADSLLEAMELAIEIDMSTKTSAEIISDMNDALNKIDPDAPHPDTVEVPEEAAVVLEALRLEHEKESEEKLGTECFAGSDYPDAVPRPGLDPQGARDAYAEQEREAIQDLEKKEEQDVLVRESDNAIISEVPSEIWNTRSVSTFVRHFVGAGIKDGSEIRRICLAYGDACVAFKNIDESVWGDRVDVAIAAMGLG